MQFVIKTVALLLAHDKNTTKDTINSQGETWCRLKESLDVWERDV
jgi:hypothetical protein